MEKLILACFLLLLVGKVATTGRDLGQSCSRSTDPCVHPYHKLVCDRLASKCVLAEGELCGRHGTEGLCVSGAHCQVLADDTSQCRCGTAGYTANGGYCDIETNKYGGSCSNGNCFDSTLTCRNTTDTGLYCDCVKGRNPDIFVTGTCHEELVFVGALCNSAEDCSQTHFDAYRCVSHRCQCAPGYNGLDGEECEEIVDEAVGKACDVNTGQGCGEQRTTHLECSPQDGVCTCVHGYVGLTGNQCYPAAGRLHGGCNASTSGVQGTCLHDRHVCIHDHTDGPMYCQDLCQLPSDTGLCKAYLPRFFYHWATGECQQFVYGGCGGNANRFETKENCQATCSKDYICQLPSETGPCEAYFPSFYYNSETGTCQQFIYGGCGGNANRFETKGECHAACSKDVCQQPKDSGMCVAYFPRYFYNLTSGACEEFIYGGCGANDNNFENKTQCKKACVKDACEQPKQPGMCHGYFPRYFYNPTSGTCDVFIYGGCGGNENNFDNETQCEKTCLKDVCQQPKETGRCRGYFPRYFYNPTSGTCEDFVYGGCGGNDNNFDNKTQCDEACVKDVCQEPKETGVCRGYFPRYFYNPASGACENFIYGGCGGNENNFENKTKCEKTCLEDIDVCDQPKETGMCRGYFPRHFYNPTSGTCEDFVYGGCGGNGNNFENKTQCEKACVKGVCQQPKETGICRGYFPRYFYNPLSGTCQDFVYGGCGGNENNFQNKTQCEKACVKDVCQQPKETGMCRGYFPRYFYNPTSGTCENFVYGGCGGNGNNFDNKTQCEKTCLKDVCHQPGEPGRCRSYFPRYFYNPTSGICENFVYGGCGGNENNFESLKDCKHACMNEVVCQQPQRAGRCQAYFTKYYYNTQTDACEDFVYGGCDGNDNNFETKVQCQDTCVKETGGSRRLQSWIVITVLAVLTEWCFIHL